MIEINENNINDIKFKNIILNDNPGNKHMFLNKAKRLKKNVYYLNIQKINTII